MTSTGAPTSTTWRPDQVRDLEAFLCCAGEGHGPTLILDGDTDQLDPCPEWTPPGYTPPAAWPEPSRAEALAALDRIVAWSDRHGHQWTTAEIATLEMERAEIEAMAETTYAESEKDKANGTEQPHYNTEDTHKRPSLRSMFDITQDADAELSWQADGLIPNGGIVLFVGGKSSGKSTLSRQYALCVARGDPFLGREVEQGAVVIASLEDPKGVSSEHWHQLGLTADDAIFGWDGALPEDPTAWLNEVYDAVNPRLILIDSFGRWTRGKASLNSYDEIIGITEPILAFSRRTKCVVAFTHHVRKGGGDDVSETVSGSMALIGLMDSTLHLLRDGNGGRTIQTTQRAGVDIETTALGFDSGHVTLGGVVWQERAKETEAKVLALIPANGDPLPNSIIHKRIRGNKQAVTRVLHKLVDDGIIETVGNGTRKHPLAYRLRLDPR